VVLPNPNGSLAPNRFIGEPDFDRYDTDRSTFGWLFEHRFNDAWVLRQNTRFTRNDVDYFTHYGDSFTEPGGWAGDPVNKRLFGRFQDATRTHVRMVATDQHVEGDLDLAGMQHKLLLGIDALRFKQTGEAGFNLPIYYPGGTVPLIDAYDPVYGNVTPLTLSDSGRSGQRHVGMYVQDQMKLAGNWIVVAGLRHDRATSEPGPGLADETTSATSKRAGLMYAADNGWSPYVSYSESFTPQANRNAQSFKPLRGKQWEGGVKYQSPTIDGLGFSALWYELKENNQIVETMPNAFEQLNHTWARGAELEAKARFGALDLIAHYNHTKLDPQLENAPKHQAAVWGKYRFALGGIGGLSFGAGVRHMSAYADGAAPEIPAVTLLDLLLAWEATHWRVALNVNNATDEIYVASCLSRGDCWWGTRRNAVASVTYRW
jgi:iron complex outermembrane receptor protein